MNQAHKLNIFGLILAGVSLVGLCLVCGSTVAYLTNIRTIRNTFIIKPPRVERQDTLRYYLVNGTNTYTFATSENTIAKVFSGDMITFSDENTAFITPVNGLRLAYATIGNSTKRYYPGDALEQPDSNLTVNIYLEPVNYSITYDYNGRNIALSGGSEGDLLKTYNVFSYIKLPYDKRYQAKGTFIGIWTTKNYNFYVSTSGFVSWSEIKADETVLDHTFANDWTIQYDRTILGNNEVIEGWTCPGKNNESWCSDFTPANNLTRAQFNVRQSGDLTLQAKWSN